MARPAGLGASAQAVNTTAAPYARPTATPDAVAAPSASNRPAVVDHMITPITRPAASPRIRPADGLAAGRSR
ncbi:hypothetical protein [Sphaerisporangium dianthi]|uniref:Uncharacterized protein n=1 Tax=Sphaerisporangium dianthi TaxID=1436120 RepID=A0ABV9CV21_9ACTN